MGKCLKKGVLECILRILPVFRDPICRSQKCAEVTVSELSEGIDISVLCRHDQRLVTHLSQTAADYGVVVRQHSLIHSQRPFSRGNAGIASCTRWLSRCG